jgi:hypothetical protein
MGKKSSKTQSKEESQPATGGLPFISGSASLDPTLSSLFAASVRCNYTSKAKIMELTIFCFSLDLSKHRR